MALLHDVAKSGILEKIKRLLSPVKEFNPDILMDCINEKNNEGQTSLCLAAKGHLDVDKYLIDNVADNTENCDNDGRTALHRAAEEGDIDTVTYLLMNGAEYNTKDKEDKTPLHHAASKGHKDVVESLITHVHNNNPDIVVQYINEKNDDGFTVLHYAALNGDVDIVTQLLDKGAEYNTKDNLDMTPLHYAAGEGHKNIIVSIITHVHNNHPDTLAQYINEKNGEGITALHLAAMFGNVDIVTYLLDNGANYNAWDKSRNMTLLHCVAEEGYKDVVASLITHVKNNNPDTLLQYINKKDSHDKTALHYAKKGESKETMEYLIINGAI